MILGLPVWLFAGILASIAAVIVCGVGLALARERGRHRNASRRPRLRIARWELPIFQAHYRRQYRRADRKAFRAEMAALAGPRDDEAATEWLSRTGRLSDEAELRADAVAPILYPEHTPECDSACGGDLAHAEHLDDGWCPCCYCAQFAVTAEIPAQPPAQDEAATAATPAAAADMPALAPSVPQGPGLAPDVPACEPPALETAPSGLGQHPYAGEPLYGIATVHRDGLLLAVDGTGPCAVIRQPGPPSLRDTGALEALAAPAAAEWDTSLAGLTRLLYALRTLDVA